MVHNDAVPVSNKPLRYIWNILIAIDQLANAMLGGDPDETISSRLGKFVRDNQEDTGFKGLISNVTCELLDVIDPGHCQKSIEDDEGKHEVIDW